ncbi:MAG: hypothetical protein JWN45_1117 [Acidobacteriaceae bacterium]|nr:hypothetical protein [Acidobacteriaceae bacterium]
MNRAATKSEVNTRSSLRKEWGTSHKKSPMDKFGVFKNVATLWCLTICLVGCRMNEVTQRVPSPDNAYVAEIYLDRGNATQHPWEFVFVRKANPTLTDFVLRRTRKNIFSNLNRGGVNVEWKSSRTLWVRCYDCEKSGIRQGESRWNEVDIFYSFEVSPTVPK